MRLLAVVQGMERTLAIRRSADTPGALSFALDGQTGEADVREVLPGVYSILLGSRCFEVKIEESAQGYIASVAGHSYDVILRDPRKLSHGPSGLAETGPRRLAAPMPGRVVRVLAEEGAEVVAGQGLVVVEAMKMQNEIKSPKAGLVKSVHVKEGASVGAGELLVVVD
jgi:biotin carboxyl carrier protein